MGEPDRLSFVVLVVLAVAAVVMIAYLTGTDGWDALLPDLSPAKLY